MKSIITILVCLCAMPAWGKALDITEHDFVDTINITYHNGLVMVPVTIKGQTYQFFYDTGASICMLPDSLYLLLDKELGGEKVLAFNNKDSKKMRNGIMAEMTIGNIHLNGMKSVLMPSAPFGCLLGANALYKAGIIAKLDVRNNILILTDRKDYFDNEGGFDIPIKRGSMCPHIRFTLSHGCSGNALFDTGFNSFMNISRKYYDKSIKGVDGELFKQQIAWSDYGSTITGINGAETPEEKIRMKMEEVRLETRGDKQETTGENGEYGLSLCNIPVETSRNYTAIGSRILQYGSMIINPCTHTLRYQPYDHTNKVDIKGKVHDLAFNTSDGRVKIELINPNSIFYKQGVRKGAYITSINDQPVITYADYVMSMKQIKRGASYTLTFQNPDGQTIKVVRYRE